MGSIFGVEEDATLRARLPACSLWGDARARARRGT
jgi:hypothetical protein